MISTKSATSISTREIGADVVMEELVRLEEELQAVVERCTVRVNKILRAEAVECDASRPIRTLDSELFNNQYQRIENCRETIRQFHSVIDRIDL